MHIATQYYGNITGSNLHAVSAAERKSMSEEQQTMTIDEILELVHNDGRCSEANYDVVDGEYMSPKEAKQAIEAYCAERERQLLERLWEQATDNDFQTIDVDLLAELVSAKKAQLTPINLPHKLNISG